MSRWQVRGLHIGQAFPGAGSVWFAIDRGDAFTRGRVTTHPNHRYALAEALMERQRAHGHLLTVAIWRQYIQFFSRKETP